LGELHALRGEALHVGRAVPAVEVGDLGVERHGGLLPAHVVDEEEDEVGTFGGVDAGEEGGKGREEGRESGHAHG